MKSCCKIPLAVLAALVGFAFSGCTSDDESFLPVRGKVVFLNGDPVKGGSIELESKSDSMMGYIGTIQEDGTFEIDGGAPSGVYRVAIHANLPPDDDPDDKRLPKNPVKDKFESFNSSGLELIVGDDAKEHTLEVEHSSSQ